MLIYSGYTPTNVFYVILMVDNQNTRFDASPTYIFHTNSVKCFSVIRVYLNGGFSVYATSGTLFQKTTSARVTPFSAVVLLIVMYANELFYTFR